MPMAFPYGVLLLLIKLFYHHSHSFLIELEFVCKDREEFFYLEPLVFLAYDYVRLSSYALVRVLQTLDFGSKIKKEFSTIWLLVFLA
jgi:hypothetical protein